MDILVTGAAGFIGYHLTARLLRDGHNVTGIDNLNSYYDPDLKKNRLAELKKSSSAGNFQFFHADISNKQQLVEVCNSCKFSHIVNLAAQAGVRYSLKNPSAYIQSNIVGFANILEMAEKFAIEHLLYASSSSVYGLNSKRPYSTHDNVDHPLSLYAATKKSNELLAHSFANITRIPATGLRFFTVYGPWGRPDMAPYIFTDAILHDKPLRLFNNGQLLRDFTYIDDIIEGLARLIPKNATPSEEFDPQKPDPATSSAPWRIYNIGNATPIPLMDFVHALENALHKKAIIELAPMQPGDTLSTEADVDDLAKITGFTPSTSLTDGLQQYAAWHQEYYGK